MVLSRLQGCFRTMHKLKKINVICAADENLGIGKNRCLPWKLPSEYAYFRRLATFRKDKTKKNAAIIGRKTFVFEPHRKADEALSFIVISKTLSELPGCAAHVCRSVADAVQLISSPPLANTIENVWIWGGGGVYKEALGLEECNRVYLTRVYAKFDCDAFFPGIDTNHYRLMRDPNIGEDIQEENGIKFKFEIYERFQEDTTCNKDQTSVKKHQEPE